MNESWIDHELRNWSRWANSGPSDKPRSPGSCLRNVCVPDNKYVDEDVPPPIHEENAKKVQRVFDVSATIERKVMQAEYLSPWQYGRNRGVASAASVLKISTPSYETILTVVKRRVERVFT